MDAVPALPPSPPSGGTRAVLEALAAGRAARRDLALALVVATQGSTYRKPGAIALVEGDGRRHGVISGGCLEPELDRVAALALREGRAQRVRFDTQGDDDLLFGSGSGCRGVMQLLVLPLPADAPAPWVDRLLAAADAGLALDLVLAPEAEPPAVLAIGESEPDAPFALAAPAGAPTARVRPPPRALLLGAGPEAPPLARGLRQLGWWVTVADHRPGLADPARLEAADRVVVARPAAALATLGSRFDAAVAMTHSASADGEALAALAASAIPHLGLLGPPARRDELLATLAPDARAALGGRLEAPVGLALGGEGPEAIALAIVAGLQRRLSGERRR